MQQRLKYFYPGYFLTFLVFVTANQFQLNFGRPEIPTVHRLAIHVLLEFSAEIERKKHCVNSVEL